MSNPDQMLPGLDLSLREYVAGVLARTATETARRALVQCYGEGGSPIGHLSEEALRTLDTSSSDERRDWSLQNSSTENHPIKEGAAFKR